MCFDELRRSDLWRFESRPWRPWRPWQEEYMRLGYFTVVVILSVPRPAFPAWLAHSFVRIQPLQPLDDVMSKVLVVRMSTKTI